MTQNQMLTEWDHLMEVEPSLDPINTKEIGEQEKQSAYERYFEMWIVDGPETKPIDEDWLRNYYRWSENAYNAYQNSRLYNGQPHHKLYYSWKLAQERCDEVLTRWGYDALVKITKSEYLDKFLEDLGRITERHHKGMRIPAIPLGNLTFQAESSNNREAWKVFDLVCKTLREIDGTVDRSQWDHLLADE